MATVGSGSVVPGLASNRQSVRCRSELMRGTTQQGAGETRACVQGFLLLGLSVPLGLKQCEVQCGRRRGVCAATPLLLLMLMRQAQHDAASVGRHRAP